MRYRTLDANGDYTFGQGSANFLVNSAQSVAQAVLTGLKLWQGEWFVNTAAGMPWATQVLGYGTKAFYDAALQAQVKSTTGVTGLTGYSSTLNSITRLLVATISGTSLYGPFTVTVSVPTAGGGFGEGGFAEGGFGQ